MYTKNDLFELTEKKTDVCLSENSCIITMQSIKKYISEEINNVIDLEIYERIDSTNTQLKLMAESGAGEWKILLANEQTAGRGRMNRKFFSPANTGIYISFLFRPEISAEESLAITTMAAVAVSNAIEAVTGKETGIKWVNDIYIGDRKVAGILTEASINTEKGGIDYAVLGIGINVQTPDDGFPDEIKDIADAIMDSEGERDDIRSRIAARVIEEIYWGYKCLDKHEFMKKYREKSILIGKEVYITSDSERKGLFVKGITDDAGLVVEDKYGNERILSSGEVSVRKLER